MKTDMSFKKWLAEMAGGDAIVSSCKPKADYQVWGACSDLKRSKGRYGKKSKVVF